MITAILRDFSLYYCLFRNNCDYILNYDYKIIIITRLAAKPIHYTNKIPVWLLLGHMKEAQLTADKYGND